MNLKELMVAAEKSRNASDVLQIVNNPEFYNEVRGSVYALLKLAANLYDANLLRAIIAVPGIDLNEPKVETDRYGRIFNVEPSFLYDLGNSWIEGSRILLSTPSVRTDLRNSRGDDYSGYIYYQLSFYELHDPSKVEEADNDGWFELQSLVASREKKSQATEVKAVAAPGVGTALEDSEENDHESTSSYKM